MPNILPNRLFSAEGDKEPLLADFCGFRAITLNYFTVLDWWPFAAWEVTNVCWKIFIKFAVKIGISFKNLFFFEIIEFYRRVTDTDETVSDVKSLHNHSAFVESKKLSLVQGFFFFFWCKTINLMNYDLVHRLGSQLPNFSTNLFFCSRPPHCTYLSFSLVFHVQQLYSLSLSFMTWTVLKYSCQASCGMSLSVGCLMFSRTVWDCGFSGRITESWCSLRVLSRQGAQNINMTCYRWRSPWLLASVLFQDSPL